jgi:hypothetical protein
MVTGRDLAGWTPVRVFDRDGEPCVEWCDLTSERFDAPFFRETVERAVRRPFNRAFRVSTPLRGMLEQQEVEPGPDPRLFIFHGSRCGSTLIAQMLATLPRTRVVSEAEPIESVLRLPMFYRGWDSIELLDVVRATIRSLGGSRSVVDRSVIKFDPWHTLDAAVIRRAFPDVPAVYVYRHPLEVFASHARNVSGRMLAGPIEWHLARLKPELYGQLTFEDFCIRVLRRWSEAGLDAARTGAALVEYTELPGIVPRLAMRALECPAEGAWRTAMLHVARRDAKNRAVPFADDSAVKRLEVPSECRVRIESELMPLYAQLEKHRRARSTAEFVCDS